MNKMNKPLFLFCFITLMFSLDVSASNIRFDSIVLENGKEIARPSVESAFGKEAVVEIAGHIKFVVVADEPQGDISEVKASIYYYNGSEWVLSWAASMSANISLTPSFEHDLKDGKHRVVIMPRRLERK